MNNQPGANISEHAFGNAIDVGAFRLASGREVTVERGWKGAYEERGFLRQVHAAACERFSTVLGPGADVFHYNHFHLDLARRASGRGICRPAAEELPPPLYRDRQGIPLARQAPLQAAPIATARTQSRPADLPLAANMASMPRPQTPANERDPRPVGEPLNLSPPTPRAANAPLGPTVIERQPYPAQPAVQPYPAHAPSPNRPLPPASVPQAKVGADPQVTGSIDKRRYFKETPILKSGLPDAKPGED
jgi:hypothetical protein